MATITPGEGGTFKTSTLEGRLIEVAAYLQALERSATANPQGLRQLTPVLNLRNAEYSGSFQVPILFQNVPNGGIEIVANPYLVGSTVISGTGSPTIRGLTAEAQFLQAIMLLQEFEQLPARNPTNRNLISATLDSETRLMSGSFTIPIQSSLSDTGQIVVSAVPYLID